MMLIAYVVVEVETKDSWKWFLKLLLDDLQSIQHKVYVTLIQGLMPTIIEKNQYIEHR